MAAPRALMSAWRVVVGFGVVSLAADVVYEGARSVTGPLLASLGASALLVGLVTGAGEAVALVLRLFFGPLADRTGRYWSFTIAGYALTAVSVPLLAVTPLIGATGVAVACVLILGERAGKAIRSPAKSALLAHAAGAVGRGRGFAVHKALDQVGAFVGPLLVAGVIAVSSAIWPALAALAVPGAVAMVLLVRIRSRVPDPSVYEPEATATALPAEPRRSFVAAGLGSGLPREFFSFAAGAGLVMAGLVTFGVIGFHLTQTHTMSAAAVPLAYAAAMAAGAVGALSTGYLYDRSRQRVLLVLPFLGAAVPSLALSTRVGTALAGVIVWGLAMGVQDSTVKALVADLVPAPRRATAYGVFAAIQGAGALVGGGIVGYLYERSMTALVLAVLVMQGVALLLLVGTFAVRRARH